MLETGALPRSVNKARRLHCTAVSHLQQLCCDQLSDAASRAGNQHCVTFRLHTGVQEDLSGYR